MVSELAGIDWFGRGWLLVLAFSVAVLLVAAMRQPCRRWFGTERAFQLWVLLPLAMLAGQLPHPAAAPAGALPSVIYLITSAASGLPAYATAVTALDWRAAAMLLWLLGTIAALLLAAVAQWRYRRCLIGATPMLNVAMRWPVLRAAVVDVGPALVGAWRARIVLPADFDTRYDAAERALILAHEATHARRGDGWWCLCAQIVAAVFWFHPLAWWALAALRHDQELACDAAVLREHGAQRRSYAHAMLKTQSAAFALPVGCSWSPRHPITERIAMLKLPCPNRLQNSLGVLAGAVLALGVTGVVYAAGVPANPALPDASATAADAHEYQLDMAVELARDIGHRTQSQKVTAAICVAPGETGVVTMRGLRVEADIVPQLGKQIRVDMHASGSDKTAPASARLQGVLGEPLHADGKSADGARRYSFDVIPLAGCPGRMFPAQSGALLKLITHAAVNIPARAVAQAVAAKAGLVLSNPQALDSRLISLNFEQIPAGRAMQLIADIDGRKTVFDGIRVRFEPK